MAALTGILWKQFVSFYFLPLPVASLYGTIDWCEVQNQTPPLSLSLSSLALAPSPPIAMKVQLYSETIVNLR